MIGFLINKLMHRNREFMTYTHRLMLLFYFRQAGALPRVTSTAVDRSSLKEKCPFLITCYTVVSCIPIHTYTRQLTIDCAFLFSKKKQQTFDL